MVAPLEGYTVFETVNGVISALARKVIVPNDSLVLAEDDAVELIFSEALPLTFRSSNYASLAAAITSIGSTVGTLLIENADFPSGGTCTVPPTLVINWGSVGTLLLTTGHIVTIKSDTSQYPIRKIFYNALVGQGTVIFTANFFLRNLLMEYWGGAADNVTDNCGPLNALLDSLNTSNLSANILCQSGIYAFSGPLLDTSLSNAQIPFPKRQYTQNPIAIRFIGSNMPHPFPHTSGTIFRSTLASGTGSFMSVKCNWGTGTADQGQVARNALSSISFSAENVSFMMPANPINTCLDLRFIPNGRLKDVCIFVDGMSVSSGNLVITEPTNVSYGLRTPVDYAPNAFILDHVLIMGFNKCAAFGELVYATYLECAAAKVGIELRGGSHKCHLNKYLCVATATHIKAGGLDPAFPSGNNNCILKIDGFDYENGGSPAWTTTTHHIDDPNNYILGEVNYSSTAWPLAKNGGKNLITHPITEPWHSRKPFTQITPFGFTDPAVHEISRGLQVTDSSGFAINQLVTHQSGLNNLVGLLAFVNDAIATGNYKALAWLTVITSGAINSGQVSLDIMKDGVITPKAVWDKHGNYSIAAFEIPAQGSTLTITSGSITPVFGLHTVTGNGPLTTIVLPAGVAAMGAAASCIIRFIAAQTFPFNDSGNILNVGTCVANNEYEAAWMPNLGLWAIAAANPVMAGSLSVDDAKMIRFYNPADLARASFIRHEIDTGSLSGHALIAKVEPISGQDSSVDIQSHCPTGQISEVHLRAFINAVERTGLLIDDTGVAVNTTQGAFYAPNMTTTQKNAFTPIRNGAIIYDETTDKFCGYANGAWVDLH